MSRRIREEDLRLNLIINGKNVPAENKKLLSQLGKLERETRELALANENLELQRKNLDKADVNYATKLRNLDNQIKANSRTIKANRAAMRTLRNEIGLSGLTLQQLRNHLKLLRIEQAHMTKAADPTHWRKLQREIKLTNQKIIEVTTGAGRMKQAWDRFAHKANAYGTALGWLAMVLYGLIRMIGKVTGRMTSLEDAMASMRKTTELTADEAWELKEAFDAMDTRTKSEDMLAMARVAGRLGVRGVKDIREFAEAMNIVYTGLGEDLEGEVEDVVRSIGKVVNAFNLDDDLPLNEALMRTGNLLNELDKNSEAQAGNVLEYLTRLSGIGQNAKISINDLAGYGAVLDAVNVRAERGGTALQKLIVSMAKHTQEYARLLGMTHDEYKRMVDEDANQVLLKLLKMASEDSDGLIATKATMDKLGLSGERLIQVFGVLVNNYDDIIKQQAIAGKAIGETNSIWEEYILTNENFAGLVDKEKKKTKAWSDLLLKKFRPAVLSVMRGFNEFLIVLRDVGTWLYDHSALIKGLVSLYVVYKSSVIAAALANVYYEVAIKALIIQENLLILKTRILTAANKAYRIAMIATSGSIVGVVRALKLLWAAMTVNPIGWIVGLIGAMTAAYFFLQKKTEELTASQKNLLRIQKMIAEGYGAVAGAAERMFDQLKREQESKEEYKKLLKSVNDRFGKYIGFLLSERTSLKGIEIARQRVIKGIREEMELKAKDRLLTKLYDEKAAADLNKDLYADEIHKVDKGTERPSVWEFFLKGKNQPIYNYKSVTGKSRNELYDLWAKNDKLSQNLQAQIDLLAPKDVKESRRPATGRRGMNEKGMPGYVGPKLPGSELLSEQDYKDAFELLESAYQEEQLLMIQENRKRGESAAQLRQNELKAEERFLRDKIDLQERSMIKTVDLVKTKLDLEKNLTAQGKTNKPKLDEEIRDYDLRKSKLEQRKEYSLISEEDYNREKYSLTREHLENLKEIYEEYGVDLSAIQRKINENELNEQKELMDRALAEKKASIETSGRVLNQTDEEIKQSQLVAEERYYRKLARLQFDAGKKKEYSETVVRLNDNLKAQGKTKRPLIDDELRDYNLRKAKLGQAHKEMLISDEQYTRKSYDLNKDHLLKMKGIYEVMGLDTAAIQLKINQAELKEQSILLSRHYENEKLLIQREGREKHLTNEQIRQQELKAEEKYLRKMMELQANARDHEGYNKSAVTFEKNQVAQGKTDRPLIDEVHRDYEFNMSFIQQDYDDLLITKEQYNRQVYDQELAFLNDLKDAYEKSGLDTEAIQAEIESRMRRKQTEIASIRLGYAEDSIDPMAEYEAEKELEEIRFQDELARFSEQGLSKEEIQKAHLARMEKLEKKHEATKLKQAQAWLSLTGDALNVAGQMYEARMNRELKAAEGNEAEQEKIRKKYAKKQQKLAIAQAMIAGALGVMQIWAAKPSMPSGIAEAYKTIQTILMVARTGAQIAAIASAQYNKGKYPVMGKDDGDIYHAELMGPVRTGVYDKPTLGLFSENKPEMVIDNPTLENMKMNAPGLIQAIYQMRVPQYATGKYPSMVADDDGSENESMTDQSAQTAMLITVVQKLSAQIDKGIDAKVQKYGTYGLEEAIKDIDRVNENINY